MTWIEELFVKRADLYAMVLEALWSRGEEEAKALADFLGQRGMAGGRVLDIPCGIGRIAVPLAKLGFTVVGIDISPFFIDAGTRKAEENAVTSRATFLVGRMQKLDARLQGQKPFDVAVNVFTSIGYGSEREDETFFAALKRVIRRGGLFILTVLRSRDYEVSHFVEQPYVETDRLLVLHRNKLDIASSRIKSNWRFYVKKGASLEFAGECPIDLRLYSPHEVASMLESTGWKVAEIFDTLRDKQPVTSESRHFSVVAEAV